MRWQWRIGSKRHERIKPHRCRASRLCYPRAAIFAFCLATTLYNVVSLLKSTIAAVHGEEAVENMSWYYAYTETQSVWSGMEIALPYDFWARRIDGMSDRELATYLKSLSEN